MLTERYVNDELPRILVKRAEYRPFPDVADRDAWDALPLAARETWKVQGEGFLNFAWPTLPATRFMDFARDGNRSRYEALHFERRHALCSLALAECIEGKGRFLDQIADGVWLICEESFWGVPAHNPMSKRRGALPDVTEPVIDLFAGETAGLLSWVHHLLGARLDDVSPLISERIRLEMRRRILDPFLDREDFWWMGFSARGSVNNWNPWCNSNCLIAFLLLEDDPDRRARAVAKVLRSLDRFLAVYHPDGGCDEGPSYWARAGGSLFDCLELLHSASRGRIDVYGDPLVGQIGRYLYRVHISGDYFINFADAGARVAIPAGLVYRYGRRIGDAKLSRLGAEAFHRQTGEGKGRSRESLHRALGDLFGYAETIAAPRDPVYERDVWLDGIQVMAARERDGSDRGLYLAAKGGHNAESHNHNDVGQFIVYLDGRPVLIDAGVETYTRKTFSAQRYEIWTMQSAYHNLPTVNGVQQQAGGQFRASEVSCRADESLAELSLNVASAYPKEAGIVSWRRACRLLRREPASVEVVDEFRLAAPTQDIVLSLMTPCDPGVEGRGDLLLRGEGARRVRIRFDKGLSPGIERIAVEDPRLQAAWGERIFRVRLCAQTPTAQGRWVMEIAPA